MLAVQAPSIGASQLQVQPRHSDPEKASDEAEFISDREVHGARSFNRSTFGSCDTDHILGEIFEQTDSSRRRMVFSRLNFRRRFFNWVIPLQSPVATHPRTSLPRRREATVRLSNDLDAPDARDALVPMCQLSEILPCTETSCQRRARDSNGESHAMRESLCPVV